MAALTRENFKAKKNVKRTILGKATVPELGGEVQICRFSAGGRDRVNFTMLAEGKGKDSGKYRARVVIESACSETGERLFTDDDLAWLSELDDVILEPILDESLRLNKYDDPKELEKN